MLSSGEELLITSVKYHRVGFVDAVEQDSVLYILGEHFENVATKDLSMEDVKKDVKGINLKVAVTERHSPQLCLDRAVTSIRWPRLLPQLKKIAHS
ncbi:MAG: hypothetical protein ACLR6J_00975 [Parabacteroides merdae]